MGETLFVLRTVVFLVSLVVFALVCGIPHRW